MKVVLEEYPDMGGYYKIIRADHDNRRWYEEIVTNHGTKCSCLMMSERITPEASVEGSADEMTDICNSILKKESCSYKRCEVIYNDYYDAFLFSSPKNSFLPNTNYVPAEDAKHFAIKGLELLRKEN